MHKIQKQISCLLYKRRAQLLLPAALLLPIFVLVIYLLVEVTKVSIAKVRHQFALDNAAYSQMTTVSVFLNAVGILNGPLPFRVLQTYNEKIKPVSEPYRGKEDWTVFDLFYQAGALPAMAPDYDQNAIRNGRPSQESVDWGVHYVQRGDWEEGEEEMYSRKDWEKETPAEIKGPVHLMNKRMVAKHYVAAKKVGIPAIQAYINTYVQVGDTYNLQKHIYDKLIAKANTFRRGYFLNVDDCKMNECARQSASRLGQFLSIPTARQETDNIMVYVSASDMAGGTGGAVDIPLSMSEMHADPLFLFAYVNGTGRSRLRTLKRGVMLKQPFPLPRNHFNINLTGKYKPYVRTTVILSCPRGNNNCVWPNPLPKYSTTLRP